jgi:hypothetical protein
MPERHTALIVALIAYAVCRRGADLSRRGDVWRRCAQRVRPRPLRV